MFFKLMEGRWKELSSGRWRTYVFFALVEVLLVTVGILLAVQVDNWNEERRENREARELLADVRDDLLANLEEIEGSLDFNRAALRNYQTLKSYVDNNAPYSSDLDAVFGVLPYWDSPHLSFTAYDSLKARGWHIIQDTQLKQRVVNMYENRFALITKDWDRWEWDINQAVIMPFFAKHVRGDLNNRYTAKPNDFEALKQLPEFMNVIGVLSRTRDYGVELCEETAVELRELIKAIDQYLAA